MPARSVSQTAPPPSLPHWEQTPANLPDAIRQTKAALRARIAASGRTVEEVFAVVQDHIEHEVGSGRDHTTGSGRRVYRTCRDGARRLTPVRSAPGSGSNTGNQKQI